MLGLNPVWNRQTNDRGGEDKITMTSERVRGWSTVCTVANYDSSFIYRLQYEILVGRCFILGSKEKVTHSKLCIPQGTQWIRLHTDAVSATRNDNSFFFFLIWKSLLSLRKICFSVSSLVSSHTSPQNHQSLSFKSLLNPSESVITSIKAGINNPVWYLSLLGRLGTKMGCGSSSIYIWQRFSTCGPRRVLCDTRKFLVILCYSDVK